MKISKKITLPLELTGEERDAVEKIQDLLCDLMAILETYDCGVVGCKDTGRSLDIGEMREIYRLLDIFNDWELEIYND